MHPQINRNLVYMPATWLCGERIGRYQESYERSQWLSPEELAALQLAAARNMIDAARQSVPHYSRAFNGRFSRPWRLETLSQLNQLPVLTKDILANHAPSLRSRHKTGHVSQKTTGGSTGRAVTIWKDADALARERAATWRGYAWAAVSIGDRQARFWGVPLSGRARLKAHITDLVANRVRLSAFEMNEVSFRRYHKQLLRFKPHYLYGYVSMLTEFAAFMEAEALSLPSSVRSVITTSEVLDETNRARLYRGFGVPVFNEYGCGEVGSIAHECEHGRLHLMAENIYVTTDPPNTTGELMVTDLHNRAMPLINYRLGDYGRISTTPCPCGRGLPVLEKLHGRAYDLITDPTGTRHHPEVVMYLFEALKQEGVDIHRFQVVQEDAACLRVRLTGVPPGQIEHIETTLAAGFRTAIHPKMTTCFEYVDEIAREASGKLRLIRSELTS